MENPAKRPGKTAAPPIWRSPISATIAAEASVRFAGLCTGGHGPVWIEERPAERGRGVIVGLGGDGTAVDLLPQRYSARSRVHEYGGGALFANGERIFFVNHADQDIYAIDGAGKPERLTQAGDTRFADMDLDRTRDRLVAVAETHIAGSHPGNFLAAIVLNGARRGEMAPLAEGADFYASPRVSPDGRRLAWLEWNLPAMPWEAAVLKCAEIGDGGQLGPGVTVAGGPDGAAYQPEWYADGSLFFVVEEGEWSGLHKWRDGARRSVFTPQAEMLRPLWALGQRTYAILGEGRIAAVAVGNGEQELWLFEPAVGSQRRIELPHRAVDHLAGASDGRLYAIVSDDDRAPAVVEMVVGKWAPAWRTLARPGAMELAKDTISVGETLRLGGADGRVVPCVYYPPRNSQYRLAGDAPPPMLVMAHGGPTGAATRGLQLKVQFWTSRGFAVLDVDYRGSVGYGRAHREALRGAWGEKDADDVIAAAKAAVERGYADPQRLIATGRSAGGFTALCALIRSNIFRAASIHFGVADLATLLATTHKFEAGYLYGLTGTKPGATEPVFETRSPLAQAGRIAAPVLLLQGLDDPAVPAQQARDIADSLRRRGVPVAHLEFAGEGHGFRRAETIRVAYLAELAFFSQVLGLATTEPLPDLIIWNWDEHS
jgi:dipeptidyl aminopeptidase/acylaminoacyl peptidase